MFEGSFLPNHLRQCPASFPPWLVKNLASFPAWVKSLACRQLPPNLYRGLYSKIVQCALDIMVRVW